MTETGSGSGSETADDPAASLDVADSAAGAAGVAAESGVDHHRAEVVADSLFDRADRNPSGADQPYGEPGSPVSRTSAFYVGFVGTLGVLAAVALGLALREVGSVMTLISISAFLAVGLNPIVEWLIRHGIRRRWSVAIVCTTVLAVVIVVAVVLVGAIRDQASQFVDDIPHLVDDLRHNRLISRLDQKYHVLAGLQNRLQDPDLVKDNFGGAFQFGVTVLGGVLNAIVIFVMTVYMLAALPSLKRSAYLLVPASRRRRVANLGDEILRRVGGYVIGAVLVALCAGTLTFILLWCVGLGSYALPLALFVAVLDLVPLVGSVTGAAVVCIVGLATSTNVGLACLIFYLIYEPLEGYVIYPRVMRSSVDVPEIVTIVAVLLGGSLAGVVGALLALPIAAAVLLLLREVWVRKQEVS